MKNPPEFYDATYLKSAMSPDAPEATRWEDNGVFFGAAMTAREIADSVGVAWILDVGCGRGFVVQHLRAMGIVSHGIEYGKAALENSVCEARQGDLTGKLPVNDKGYGLVICNGVLSHIPEDYVPDALAELWRVSGGYLWTNILTEYRETQRHHKTFRPAPWWEIQFAAAGFVKEGRFDPFLIRHGYNVADAQWSAVWRVE